MAELTHNDVWATKCPFEHEKDCAFSSWERILRYPCQKCGNWNERPDDRLILHPYVAADLGLVEGEYISSMRVGHQ